MVSKSMEVPSIYIHIIYGTFISMTQNMMGLEKEKLGWRIV